VLLRVVVELKVVLELQVAMELELVLTILKFTNLEADTYLYNVSSL
jgi:hypothetical protein